MTRVNANPPSASGFQVIDAFTVGLQTWGKVFGAILHATQTARMIGVLNQFSDKQLAEIGIERREIGNYVDQLMSAVEVDDAIKSSRT